MQVQLNAVSQKHRIIYRLIENSVNDFILNTYDTYSEISIKDIKTFFDQNPDLLVNIKAKAKNNLLFSQPIILLLYYLFEKKSTVAKRNWPFETEKMSLITSDLGRG